LTDHPAPLHAHGSDTRRLGWALAITATFMVLEVVGGLLSGSLALLADAGHMLTDTAALALAWFAARISQRSASNAHAGDHHRVQVRAAFVNSLALLAVVAWILWEAAQRLEAPREIAGGTMLGIALLGLLANVAVLRVLEDSDGGNLNVSAARLHVLGDLLGSIAASVAAVVILATGWTPIDPLLSVLVALLILRSTLSLLRKTSRSLLAGRTAAPKPDKAA
jgi:cobalt-zinc-cadmium efflux system protein